MSTSNSEVLVGIFKGETQAQDAIVLLRDVEFSDDQIGYVLQKDSSGRKRLHDLLMNLDIAEVEARYYESRFDAGHSIVFIKHNGRRAEALNILFLNKARLHGYLNLEHADNEAISLQEGIGDQCEASHIALSGSSSINLFTSSTVVQGEMASLHRLLKDVGLEHLL